MAAGYDIVVVGGGSAGSVVAGRLAAETDARILLLELGGWDLNPLIHIPAGFLKLAERGAYAFPYATVPQGQLDGRPRPLPQARVIGGGSSINAMTYVRGQPRDYDRWRDAAGDGDAWSHADLLAHFRAMERHSVFAGPHHGTDGPWHVAWPPRIGELNLAVIQAFQEVGLPFNSDYNGAVQRGVSLNQVNLGHGRRSSAATAFLHPVRGRETLTVRTHALVERILLDGERAAGVQFVHRGRRRCARADQVVVCAGALNSPRLLMLSGIGPEDELARHRIPVAVRSPDVGRRLQDHPKVALSVRSRTPIGYARDTRGMPMLLDGLRYLLTRDGPAAGPGIESVAYYDPADPAGAPTMQTFHVPLGTQLGAGAFTSGLTLENIVLQPRSRGRVTLRDADPRSAPVIDPNWLADPEDLRTMVAGLRYARRVLRAPALAGRLEREADPGPAVDTDEGLAAFARRAVSSMCHPVGTCRMGGDEESVVDPALRVRGLEGLRVIDSSVMPNLPSANTNAAVMAIASKGVGLLLAG